MDGIPYHEDRGYFPIVNNVEFGPHTCLRHLEFEGYAENVAVVGNVSVRDEGSSQRAAGVTLNATDVRNVVVGNDELCDYTLNGINADGGTVDVFVGD